MEKIKELEREIITLSHKQTWIREGLKSFIAKLNRELGSMPEHRFFYRYNFDEIDEYKSFCWRYDCGEVSIKIYDYATEEFTDVDISTLTPEQCRLAIASFEKFIERVLNRMKEILDNYETAEELIRKYLTA